MKHTPGPWEAKDVPFAGIQIFAKVDIGKEDMSGGVLQPIYHVPIQPQLQVDVHGNVTAMLSYESWRQFPSIKMDEMQKANAKLIAVAPEMLQLLRDIRDWFEGESFQYSEEVDQLITKAEGGEK